MLRIPDTEAIIYAAMVKKLKPFQTIKGRKNALKSNPRLTALQVELAQVQHEIETLIDTPVSYTHLTVSTQPICV